jgi:2-polyprenyl-6-hydroxyphenyl methylase/3-demethylubiquinone-9 3-methyltransferase
MLRKDLKRPAFATGTADPTEIARFNRLAQEWWDPDGAFTVVHAFNRARVAHLAQRLPVLLGRDPAGALPLSGLKLLDAGCGAGIATEPLSRLGAATTGIDAAERNIEVARRHAETSGCDIDYRHILPEELVAEGRQFDAVLSLEVVEHVADLDAFLGALSRLVVPGGVLVIGTLNRTLRSYLKAILGAEYLLRLMPRGTHDWRRFVTPAELAAALATQGFTVLERSGVTLNPLTRRWSIGRDDSVAYLQFHRKAAA